MILNINRELNHTERRISLLGEGSANLTDFEFRRFLVDISSFLDGGKQLLGLFKKVEVWDVWHFLRVHLSGDLIDVTLSSRDVDYSVSFRMKRDDLKLMQKAFESKLMMGCIADESGLNIINIKRIKR
jgi:hypothetical protein